MKPFVIVFGHEKGGTGKSTMCINITLGLMYKNYKVAVLDTDSRQATTYIFFQERKKHQTLDCPEVELAVASTNDSKENSKQEDLTTILTFINKNIDKDFVIIDTAGSYTNFTVGSLNFAHLIVTPISDSILDINALVFTNNDALIRGPYAEIVFNQRKQRIIAHNATQLYWYVVRNRTPLVQQENTLKCFTILQQICKNVGAEIIGEVKDRSVLKDIFTYGLSVIDLPKITQDISTAKLNTFSEIIKITDQIIHLHSIMKY